MRRLIAVLALAAPILAGAPLAAQEAAPGGTSGGVPERRVAVSRDVDFYGSDLATLFDTTLDACQAACLADAACVAYTYNTAAAACFPKSAVGEVRPFAGGVSARVLATDPAVLARAPGLAAALGLPPADLEEAERLGREVGREHSSDEWAAADLLSWAGQAEGEGDLLGALAYTGAALALTDDPGHWRGYARLALAVEPGTAEGDAARARALPAALAAYLRGADGAAQAAGLGLAAAALEAGGRGREAVAAQRLAQSLAPSREGEAALDRLLGLYGFNVAGTRVESDAAEPRACVGFNEPLRAGFDYAPYVQLPDDALTVTARDAELCVEGLAHGASLALTLREGLPAASGEALARAVPLDLYVRDRAPAARVASRAYVVPRGGDARLPVETVNLDEVDLTLSRVSDRNLVRALVEGDFAAPLFGWDRARFADALGAPVWEGTLAVADAPLNADVVTDVPLAEALGGEPAGVYALAVAAPGQDLDERPAATQWFVLTDLGLATFQGEDGLTVVVRSLADAGAVAGAAVTLVSRDNAVLGTATTDAGGVARFGPGLARGRAGDAPALVTVSTGDPGAPADLAFLSLVDPAFDLSDRGVEGRAPAGPIDAFLATDRGAYRAGETVHATALLRDGGARALPGVPATAVLTRPDGVEHARLVSAEGAAGGHAFAFPLPANAPRGAWTLGVWADPEAAEPLASARLLVEDFLPERVDFAPRADGEARAGEALAVGLEARYLFGAPAGDLPLEGEATLAPVAEVPGYPGYLWGLHDAPFEPVAVGFGGERTAADGTARLLVDLPPAGGAAQPLEARVAVRVLDAGRPMERRLVAPVRGEGPMLGLRPPADVVPEGGTATVSVVALGPDGRPAPATVRWTASRLDTEYQWYEVDGAWAWEPVTRRERVAGGEASLADGPAVLAVPVAWGEYEVVVEGADGGAASATFAAGWYAAPGAGGEPAPDRLAVSLDRAAYAPGDTARLRIDAEGPGTALVTVLTDRVVAMEAVEVGAGGATLALPVTDEWGAGAYVAAHLLRPAERAPGQGRAPARALGLAHAAVEPGGRLLSVAIDAPPTAEPRGPLGVGVQVGGVAAGEEAYVALAAVDVGILNLTGFESPDPAAHYFGQRRLGVELRDLYGRLVSGAGGAAGALREGGDAGVVAVESAPPTEALLAFYRGPVAVGADGRAEVALDLPAFNGTVRLMAVAWSPTGVGAAQAEVVVRDPVVLTATFPRTLAPGDAGVIQLELTHVEGPAGRFEVDVEAPGLFAPAGTLVADLTPQGTWRYDVPIAAGQEPGLPSVAIVVTTPSGETLERAWTLPVVAKDPAVARTLRFTLNPGESFAFDDAVLAGFRPGTAEATLSVGPLARLDAAGLLQQLDAVPWGCTEQATSQALPLLYLAEVAEAAGLAPRADLGKRIGDAVALILANQAPNGAFGLWGAYGGDLWLDAYVTDFLSRARAAGHAVPEPAFRAAMANLGNQVAAYPDFEGGGEDLAYALLVLAREGEALVGDLRYFADAKAGAFGTPLALAQLGAALALYGDQPRADALFARAAGGLDAPDDPAVWRVDYGTPRRDQAAVLALAVEAGSRAVDRDRLAAGLAAQAGPASTQEAAWTLLAAAALAGDGRADGVTVDGAAPEGPTVLRVGDGDGGGGGAPRRVANEGAAPVDVTVTAVGVPEGEEPAGGAGYAIERAYHTLEGAPASPERVAVGDRLVAVLTVSPLGPQAGRLMVTDPLPGGFEVENPDLLASGDAGALPWLAPVATANAEARADRFLAAVDWAGAEPFRVAYVVRAVSPGEFRHPAASVEDMYRPSLRAQTAAGAVTVVE